ncbi:uncharacterized protein AAG666_007445 [Megaptera novaeangliae]
MQWTVGASATSVGDGISHPAAQPCTSPGFRRPWPPRRLSRTKQEPAQATREDGAPACGGLARHTAVRTSVLQPWRWAGMPGRLSESSALPLTPAVLSPRL